MEGFKQGNNAIETSEKICSVYGEGTITDQGAHLTLMICFKSIGGMQSMPKYSEINRQAKHVTIHHMPSLGKDGCYGHMLSVTRTRQIVER